MIKSITLNEYQSLLAEAVEYEKTKKPFVLYCQELSLHPNGHIDIIECNFTVATFEEAVAAAREEALRVYNQGMGIYGRIIEGFNENPQYDEYFTEKFIASKREYLELVPGYIEAINLNKFFVGCKSCKKSHFVEHPNFTLDVLFNQPPTCICGSVGYWA